MAQGAKDLTQGSVLRLLIQYSLPYLLATFLQTFYGLADLFIVGQFCNTASISAVSCASQTLHLITVIIAGFSTGVTILVGQSCGQGDKDSLKKISRCGLVIFLILSIIFLAILLLTVDKIIFLLKIPHEAILDAKNYLIICFCGVPFIAAFNVLSSVFRGQGDSKTPLIVVSISGAVNIVADIFLVKIYGVSGAASATIISEAISVIILLLCDNNAQNKTFIGTTNATNKNNYRELQNDQATGFFKSTKDNSCTHGVKRVNYGNFNIQNFKIVIAILKIGAPIAAQELLIQISFLVITRIANSLGLSISAAVGITEKIISLLFLVNSAMLSAVSVVAAQNIGAARATRYTTKKSKGNTFTKNNRDSRTKKEHRADLALKYGIFCVVIFGVLVAGLCQIIPGCFIAIFSKGDNDVIELGSSYLRAYSIDCILAGVHFCFSGYFCACGKSVYSFIHNMISVVVARIPLAYLAAQNFSTSLYPMGLAAPIGSLLSCIICILLLRYLKNCAKSTY